MQQVKNNDEENLQEVINMIVLVEYLGRKI
jgi:hypothetical protein